MRLTILKENLKEGLSIVERVVAKSSSLPILQNILVVAQENFLELLATDLEIGIRYRVLAQVEEPGKVVVPAHFLSQFIGLLPEDKIRLETTQAGLAVQAKGYNTTIKTLDAGDFPTVPQPKETEQAIEIQTGVFCQGLEQVVGMAGQSSSRPEISGVFFSFHEKTVKLVATDSFRLAEKTLSFEKSNTKEISFILPQKTARELGAVLGEKTGKTKIYISPTQAVFDYTPEEQHIGAHIQIVSRLIEGEYPRYQDIIPKQHSTQVTIEKGEFVKRLKAAAIFSGKLSDVTVLADPAKKGVELVSQSAEVGENTSFLEAQVEGEATEARFNWRFLLDGISHIKGGDLQIGLGGADAPATIQAVGQKGYLYIIMPIRA